MPRLHVLGSAGWVPTLGRQTNCYLLETRRSLVVFDCGTGISRLHDPMLKELVARHRRAIVLLSHWHHDHIEGLHTLPFFFRDLEVVLGVPGRKAVGVDPFEVLARYGGAPMLPKPLPAWQERFGGGFRIVELEAGTNNVGGEKVEVTVQPHSDPSLGFRVRDVCYVTDTKERPETAEFAKKAALLIHDAWLDRQGALAAPDEASVHGTAEGAGRVAAEAGVKDLVLAHLNPAYDTLRLERLVFEAAAAFPRALLAADMMTLKVEGLDEPAEVAAPAADGSAAGGSTPA